MYFGISKLLGIAKHQTEESEVLAAHVEDFRSEVVPLISKMRVEHIKALCLATVGLNPCGSGVNILPYHVCTPESVDYDLHINAPVVKELLEYISDEIQRGAATPSDANKTTIRTKTRSLILKQGQNEDM